MKATILTGLLFLVAAPCAAAPFDDALAQAGDNIDIGTAAFLLAREVDPMVDVASCSARLDALAERVKTLAGADTTPEARVQALNAVIVGEGGFRANRNAVYERTPAEYQLHQLLSTRTGNCVSMPLLYVAVAQRLGWPVFLVHVPDHMFARYVDGRQGHRNIEATSGGGFASDEQYARDFRVPPDARAQGVYLRSVTRRETAAVLLEMTATQLARAGRLDEAGARLRQAVQIDHLLVTAWQNLANYSGMKARGAEGIEAAEYQALARRYAIRAHRLGFVHPRDIPVIPARRPTS